MPPTLDPAAFLLMTSYLVEAAFSAIAVIKSNFSTKGDVNRNEAAAVSLRSCAKSPISTELGSLFFFQTATNCLGCEESRTQPLTKILSLIELRSGFELFQLDLDL